MKNKYFTPELKNISLLEAIKLCAQAETDVLEIGEMKIWYDKGNLYAKEGGAKEKIWSSPEALNEYIRSTLHRHLIADNASKNDGRR